MSCRPLCPLTLLLLTAPLLGANCFEGELFIHVTGPGTVIGDEEEPHETKGVNCREQPYGVTTGCHKLTLDANVFYLIAVPDERAAFGGWEVEAPAEVRECDGSSDRCAVHIPANRIGHVHATFFLPVDCAHPGALPGDAGGDCLCSPNTVDPTGRWYERYNCELDGACVVPKGSKAWDVSVEGGYVTARADGDEGVLEGDLCGDVFAWRDTETSGLSETGVWSFSEAEFTGTSRYVVSMSGKQGACVSVGVRAPNGPPPIPDPLCVEEDEYPTFP